MINYDFISKLEGNKLKGYVPDSKNSRSGVTIASGFDLGSKSSDWLYDNLSESLAQKLELYIGLIKDEAVDYLSANPLKITLDESVKINKAAHNYSELLLISKWHSKNICWFDLSDECQTVIASVAFQYGDLSRKCPNFWMQITSCDWSGALKNLRNFGDRYPTRRNKEADLLEGWINN